MTSNTAPYGEAFGSHLSNSSYTYYKAFDNSTALTSLWQSDSAEAYLGYDFLKKVCIKMVNTTTMQATNGDSVKNFKIQGSNTKEANDWHDISDVLSTSAAASGTSNWFTLASNISSYRYIRMYVISNYGGSVKSIGELRLYGFDYSEKEFEEGTTKKWLYDHGVELESINYALTTTTSTAINDGERIQFNTNASTANGIGTTNLIDLSDYDLIRAKVGNNFYSSGTESFFYVAEQSSLAGLDPEASSSYAMSDGNLPNNLGLDISSVNSQRCVIVYCQYGTRTQKADLVEWWLE
jgi:hypothetical protein